jgi:hypothetical protein
LDQVQKFLLASEKVRFEANQRAEVYAWAEQVLRRHEYARQGRRARATAALHRKNDGAEPGADYAANWLLPGNRLGAVRDQPTASLCQTLSRRCPGL